MWNKKGIMLIVIICFLGVLFQTSASAENRKTIVLEHLISKEEADQKLKNAFPEMGILLIMPIKRPEQAIVMKSLMFYIVIKVLPAMKNYALLFYLTVPIWLTVGREHMPGQEVVLRQDLDTCQLKIRD